MQAAVFDTRDGPFHVEDVEIDEPGPGEVLIRVAATGICHTDGLARHGDLPFPAPGVLGHEGAGTVAAVGPGVASVGEGDRVVMGWPWCGECRNCLAGEPRYCARLGELLVSGVRPGGRPSALRRADGSVLHGHFFGQSSFATFALSQARSLVTVPADVPLELLGPLACGMSTGAGAVLTTLRPEAGSSLVVYGTGSVGLAAIMAARNSGATTIVAVDPVSSRLALARELGATHTIDALQDDPVAAVHDICGGPADNALECTGIISVVRQAADSVGMLGTCALIGGAPAGAEFSLDHLTTLWGKRIVGVLGGGGRSDQIIGALVDLYRQGRFPFDRLVSWFAFDEVEEALNASYAGKVIKPIVRMPG
ncbi:NAD(P)-dependent alcohol dehydrogenase [Actinomadura rubrisoli]|uniref:NAD(P)-dependent alcohol dehydrogenase n=1 Tax=Actinomadura rubrisoli TaxID=2530368 RepID=A0A4R5C8X2_9ACTN|nr:NAD(P)-dependent alcohol dehydrogenase [Actinomadura rubrisoli]TDD93524.1 NAD(P)-dependent alcohol dehydrogenase [Actinomadura rubrisoli]